jgi:ParB-like chromosome segregation protein Spo0J
MEIKMVKVDDLKPYVNNPRFNDDAVEFVKNSIKEFGFKVPIIIDKNNEIVAGHTRYKASLELNLKEVPCIVADDLNEEQIKAFRIADNKVGEQSTWDYELLTDELKDIININMEDFGFLDIDVDIEWDNSITYEDEEKNKEEVFYECPYCHEQIKEKDLICK